MNCYSVSVLCGFPCKQIRAKVNADSKPQAENIVHNVYGMFAVICEIEQEEASENV